MVIFPQNELFSAAQYIATATFEPIICAELHHYEHSRVQYYRIGHIQLASY